VFADLCGNSGVLVVNTASDSAVGMGGDPALVNPTISAAMVRNSCDMQCNDLVIFSVRVIFICSLSTWTFVLFAGVWY